MEGEDDVFEIEKIIESSVEKVSRFLCIKKSIRLEHVEFLYGIFAKLHM